MPTNDNIIKAASVEAPYGVNPANGKPYTYWQMMFDEDDPKRAEALAKDWEGAKKGAKTAGTWAKDFAGGFLNELFGMNEEDAGAYASYKDRMLNELPFHRTQADGTQKLNIFNPSQWDTLPETLAKFILQKKKDKGNLDLDLLEAVQGGGAGARGSASVPGDGFAIGKAPQLQSPDWQALKDKVANLNLAPYEAPQYNPWAALGNMLANIDLTSNLSGDWSKASKIAQDYSDRDAEAKASAANKTKADKNELELWKTAKEMAFEQAKADWAMKQAELGMRYQQLQMQAALAGAKARAYYGYGTGLGGGFGSMDKTAPIRQLGAEKAQIWLAQHPGAERKDLLKYLETSSVSGMIPPKDATAYQLGGLQLFEMLKQGDK